MTDAAPPAPSAVPGWYADPWHPAQLRWFDGWQWTGNATPAPHACPKPRDRSLEVLLPVNRSGWAIAAGYAGLFSIMLIFAPIAIVLGFFALYELSSKPDVGGRGRAWFGIIAGVLGTLGLIAVITS